MLFLGPLEELSIFMSEPHVRTRHISGLDIEASLLSSDILLR